MTFLCLAQLLVLCASQSRSSYDFIVVGAGMGGTVVATELSANPNYTVLLLEAGDFPVFPQIDHLVDFFDAWANPNIAHNFNSTPQKGLDNEVQNLRRAAVGGGCTAVNAGVWCLGDRRIWDHWEALGNPGWGWADMEPFLVTANQAYAGRITQGMPTDDPFMALFKNAGAEQGYEWNANPNLPNATPFGLSPRFLSAWIPPDSPPETKALRTTVWGQFMTPAVLARPNLDILTWSPATLVYVDSGLVARGVQVTQQQTGRRFNFTATREVILAGGAFDTPKLLQLSGIGDSSTLAKANVKTVVHVPGVGQNLQDHMYLPLVSPPFLDQSRPIPFNAVGQTGAIAYPNMGGNLTNFYLAAMPIVYKGLKAIEVDAEPFLFTTRGTVSISSSQFSDPLIIDPNYLVLPEDQQHVLQSFQAARDLMYSPALRALYNMSADELLPGEAVRTDDQILAYIRGGAHSDYHYAGTCKMGAKNDTMAVVDERLRVWTVKQLRIVDGSVFPLLPAGNPQLHTLMLALKASQMILEDHKE